MATRGKQGQHLKNKGLYTGGNWPQYRYGKPELRPVYNPAKAKKARLLKDATRKRELISATAEQLRDWRSTPFEFEASCRHGLRQSFCESGNAWQSSDDAAAEIVQEALLSNGAKRPTWEEGQWEYTVSPDYCACCHGPLDEEAIAKRHRFCSTECAQISYERRAYAEVRTHAEVAKAAYVMLRTDAAPETECEHCHRPFKRMNIGTAKKYGRGKFCSKECADAAKRVYAETQCQSCGKSFRPNNASQRFCSKPCAAMGNVKAPNRECEECGKAFHSYRISDPTKDRFCSKECLTLARQKGTALRAIPKTCAWCGDAFEARTTKGMYCNTTCRKLANEYAMGLAPKRLNRLVFDHFFTKPINTRPDLITPDLFDLLVEAA